VVSQENVEVVRRWLEFWSTSPDQVPSGVARFFDADADYYPVPKFPEARPCHGQDEIAQFFVGFMGAWSRYEYAIRQLVEVGDDRVLVCGRVHAEGQGSGLILEGELYYCIWLRHGRFFRLEDHLTMKGALHALGFEGETLEEAGLRAAGAADSLMSPNLDLVRSIYADWEEGDLSRVDWADPEIEYVVAEGPEAGVYSGLGEVARYVRGVLSDMADWRNAAEEYRELDDGRIFVVDRLTGRGRSTGLQGEAVGARVFEISAGRVTKLVIYSDRDRALADLGLEA
jgi:ketosteroid isomerase-like protein